MKKGDKVYCKKELELFSGDIIPFGLDYIFAKQIGNNVMLSNNGDMLLNLPIEYFNIHFCSLKEIRKLKMEKLKLESLNGV